MEKKKWVNVPTLSKLKEDFSQSLSNHNLHLQKLNAYKEIFEDSLYKDSTNAKSRYRSKRFAKVANKIVPKVEQSVLSLSKLIRLEPSVVVSDEVVEVNEDIINYQINNLIDKRFVVGRAAKKFVEQGTAIAKIGWDIKIEQVTKQVKEPIMSNDPAKVQPFLEKLTKTRPQEAQDMLQAFNAGNPIPIGVTTKKVTENKVLKNHPTIEIKDSESVIIDPLCYGNLSRAMFAIEMVKTSRAELRSSPIKYKNLDKLSKTGTKMTTDTFDGLDSTMDSEYNIERSVNFNYSDDARKKLVMYEYWGYWDVYNTGSLVGIVASWIGDTLIRLEENPYSHGKLPYAIANYNLSSTGDVWGDSLAELLYQEQRGETNAVRAMQDITDDSSTGQEFVDRTIFESTLQEDNYKAGRTVYVRKGSTPENSIFRKTTAPVPPVLFDLKGLYANDIENTVGFIGIDTKKDASSLTGSPEAHLTDTDVEDSVLGRFGGLFEDCAKLILSMNKDYLLNNNTFVNRSNKTVNIDITKVSAEMDVSVKMLSLKRRESIGSTIMELMRTNAANMSAEIAALHYIEFADLHNLPNLEAAIRREIAPKEPTPEEQEMQRLQLENAQLLNEKLKAEIQLAQGTAEDHSSKATVRMQGLQIGSINAEIEKDKASATLNYAQADKLGKQSALFEQEFGLVETGVKREQSKEDHEYQHAANMEREAVRTERELTQIEQKKEGKSPDSTDELIDYIGEGTLLNDTFDPTDQVFRNIADVNSTDTEQFKQPIRDAEAIQNEARNTVRDNLSFNKDNLDNTGN